jgi:hypothetical protein
VTVFDGATSLGTAAIDGSGNWQASVVLNGDGQHVLVAKDTDAAGNTGVSGTVTYTLDTTPPVVAITSAGGPTNQATQAVSGTVDVADAGTTVTVFDGRSSLGTASVDGTGNWQATVVLTGEGPHTLVAKDTDPAGKTGVSGAVTYTLDATPPTVAITSTGGLTNQPAQTLTGTVDVADAGTAVTVFDGTTSLGTAAVDASGNWQVSVALTGDGQHTLVAKDTDAAGNTGVSGTVTYTLDTTPPVVAITSPGVLTNTATQTVSGTVDVADAGTTVTVFDGTTTLGTAAVDGSGNWQASVVLHGDGRHNLAAKDTEAAGNTGVSGTVTYTLDTTPPSVAITSAGGLTNQPTQAVAGTVDVADAGTTVTVFEGKNNLGTATVDGSGHWQTSVVLTGDGVHSLVAKDTDAAGNTGGSNTVIFTLDTVPPVPPSLALTRDTGASASDEITSDPRITYKLSAVGDTLLYRLDGAKYSTKAPVLATDGSADGRHTVSAEEIDPAGNISIAASLTFTLDTTAPSVAIASAGGNVTTALQVITGTVDIADAGSTVILTQNGSFAGNAVVQANGGWSAAVTLGASGTDTFVASDTDVASNVGTSNAVAFTLGAPPQQNLFGQVTHDVTSPVGDIYALYDAILGRAPDAPGFSAFVAALEAGTPPVGIAQSLLASPEFTSEFGTAYTQGSDTSFVDRLYENAFHRAPDAAGLAAWDHALASGASRAEVALDIALSPEHEGDLAPVFQLRAVSMWRASRRPRSLSSITASSIARPMQAASRAGRAPWRMGSRLARSRRVSSPRPNKRSFTARRATRSS